MRTSCHGNSVDSYKGLQQIRGLNGQPKRVNAVGGNRYTIEPGVYGEFANIDELELTTRRPWGQFNGSHRYLRPRHAKAGPASRPPHRSHPSILWTLVTTGTFTVANELGQTMYAGTYAIQSYHRGRCLGNLGDSDTARELPGGSAAFARLFGRTSDRRARAYMNRVTFNKMISNTNTADIAGRRTSGLTPCSISTRSTQFSRVRTCRRSLFTTTATQRCRHVRSVHRGRQGDRHRCSARAARGRRLRDDPQRQQPEHGARSVHEGRR
jgi:hypothetical protein